MSPDADAVPDNPLSVQQSPPPAGHPTTADNSDTQVDPPRSLSRDSHYARADSEARSSPPSSPTKPPTSFTVTTAITTTTTATPRIGGGGGARGPIGPKQGVFRPCARCRLKKTKCDRIKPACSSCRKSGSEVLCVYDNDEPSPRTVTTVSEAEKIEKIVAVTKRDQQQQQHSRVQTERSVEPELEIEAEDRNGALAEKIQKSGRSTSSSSNSSNGNGNHSSETSDSAVTTLAPATKKIKTGATGSAAIRPSPLRTTITASTNENASAGAAGQVSPIGSAASLLKEKSGSKRKASLSNGSATSATAQQKEEEIGQDDVKMLEVDDKDDVVSALSVKDTKDRHVTPKPVKLETQQPRARKQLPAWLTSTPMPEPPVTPAKAAKSTATTITITTSPKTAKSSKASATTPANSTGTTAKSTATAAIVRNANTTINTTAAATTTTKIKNNGNNESSGGGGGGQGKVVVEFAPKQASTPVPAPVFVIDKNQKARKWGKSFNIFQTLGGEVSIPLWTSDQEMLLNEPRPLFVQQAVPLMSGRKDSSLARLLGHLEMDIDIDSPERGNTPDSTEDSLGPMTSGPGAIGTGTGTGAGKKKKAPRKQDSGGGIGSGKKGGANSNSSSNGIGNGTSNGGSGKKKQQQQQQVQWQKKRPRGDSSGDEDLEDDDNDSMTPTPVSTPTPSSTSGRSTTTKNTATNKPMNGTGRSGPTPPQRPRTFPCSFAGCSKSFMDKFHLDRHEARHVTEEIVCGIDGCTKAYPSISTVRRHQSIVHKKRKEEEFATVATATEEVKAKEAKNVEVQEKVKAKDGGGGSKKGGKARLSKVDASEPGSTRNSSPVKETGQELHEQEQEEGQEQEQEQEQQQVDEEEEESFGEAIAVD
ncbi:hypothetical protein BGZ54_001105 [Gamsiella multidivaricata]|nr:hypothetical protein BGZ54_001105 [Gamsiella multidivaricata]